MPKPQNVQKTNYSPFLRLPQLYDSLPCLLIMLAARCSFLEISPFAAAMFFSVFDIRTGYLGIIFSALGFLSRGALLQKSDNLLAMLFLMLYALLHPDYKSEKITSSAVTAAAVLLGGVIRFFYTPFTVYDALILLIESVTASFSYILFSNASVLTGYLHRNPSEQEMISAAVCAGIFISGFSGLTILGMIEISGVISAYLIMAIALCLPLASAGSCGVAAGLICSMNSTSAITLMGLYGISALFGNLLKSFGKYGVALGFLGSTAIVSLYIGNTVSVSVLEIFAACILFILTPKKAMKHISDFILRASHPKNPDTDSMRTYLCNRLMSIGHAFARLSCVYKSATEKRLKMYGSDICSVIDEAVKSACMSCAHCGKCIEKNYAESYRIIFSALETLENTGFCAPSNVSKEFCAMCSRSEIFLSELTHAYENYRKSLLKKGEFEHNRSIIISQYEEIADMFTTAADEISGGFCFLTELEEELADNLLNSGCPLRQLHAVENGCGETEIYVSLNRAYNKDKLSEIVSSTVGVPFECRPPYKYNSAVLTEKAMYSVEYGEKQITEGSQIISGDSITSFYTDKGKFYVIICDGMGSGKNAEKESRITGRLLEEFIKDGFGAELSVSLVNSSLSLLGEKESFSSVDMLEFDLYTANAEFYKVGCCRSFIKHGDKTEALFSSAVPIGILPEIHVPKISKRLSDGDIVIMLSDGADGSGYGYLSSERLKKLIDADKSMNEIAADIAASTGIKNTLRAGDDITVAAIKIIKNE